MQVFKSAIPHTASISPFLCLFGLHYQITPCTPRDSQRYVCCSYMPSRSISAFSFGGASRSVWSSAKLQSPACLISDRESCRRCRCGRVGTAVFWFRVSSSLYLRFEPEDLQDRQYRWHYHKMTFTYMLIRRATPASCVSFSASLDARLRASSRATSLLLRTSS